MPGPTKHERKDSNDLATFARPTTVKAVEGSDHHNSTGKDISQAQRASLEHIAQATLALMGERIHVQADSAKSSSGAVKELVEFKECWSSMGV
ncbi:hypothetical protein Tdes44962_MAKER02095 [Teratosphaeria destructans]|uniref:Uncharacterized protein n=1 Tax=Teratosphaeria destructans TaxID=418781 RepID=A0A9W7W3U2_9PEZI|nr:hypothetical protein Tdes44962_MAKER02095 [Teratosphaeria destructans]